MVVIHVKNLDSRYTMGSRQDKTDGKKRKERKEGRVGQEGEGGREETGKEGRKEGWKLLGKDRVTP